MISEYCFFHIYFENEVPVLRLNNPRFFNIDNYSDLQHELLCFAEEVRPTLLVVDFRQVTCFSMALISGLLQFQKLLAEYGGKLRLSCLSPEVQTVFRALHSESTRFCIYGTTGEALFNN